jgi:hypothetical protein
VCTIASIGRIRRASATLRSRLAETNAEFQRRNDRRCTDATPATRQAHLIEGCGMAWSLLMCRLVREEASMNWKKLLLADVLVAFLALTIWAALVRGAAMIDDLWSPTGLLLSVDLGIALTLAMVWVWRDARARGVSPIPYIVLTLLTGSAGALLYLLRRESPRTRASVRTAA